MSVFTVHEPPLRAAGAVPEPERFVFVRDGFYFWAFIAAWLWMIWHRMWLVLLIYIVVSGAVESAVYYAGARSGGVLLAGLLIALLVGVEASTLRRFTLARRGWKNVGIVNGEDLEDAERRFFDAWLRAPGKQAEPPAVSFTPSPSTPHPPDIVGLFPDPGASR
jgi:hypothetical protein